MNTLLKGKYKGKEYMVLRIATDSHGFFQCCCLDREAKKLKRIYTDDMEEVELVGLVEAGDEGGEVHDE